MHRQERVIVEPVKSRYEVKTTSSPRFKNYSELPTSNLIKNIMKLGNSSLSLNCTELLPINTRFYTKIRNENIFVTEHPPVERTIRVEVYFYRKKKEFEKFCIQQKDEKYLTDYVPLTKNAKGDYRQYTFNLVMPYVVFVSMINPHDRRFSCFLFFRNAPLKKLSDTLFKAPFYNITDSQKACIYARKLDYDSLYSLPIPQMVEELFDIFWASPFNSDYDGNMRSYSKNRSISNYFMWEYFSKTDPLSILKTNWIKYTSLEKFISFILSRFTGITTSDANFSDLRKAFL